MCVHIYVCVYMYVCAHMCWDVFLGGGCIHAGTCEVQSMARDVFPCVPLILSFKAGSLTSLELTRGGWRLSGLAVTTLLFSSSFVKARKDLFLGYSLRVLPVI